MEEKEYEKYDSICNYLLKILGWNYKEGRKFIIDDSINVHDDAQLLILSLMEKLHKDAGYELYYKGNWYTALKVSYATKIKIPQYKNKNNVFVYYLNDFVNEMCKNLNIEKQVFKDIYNEYFKEK